jgi:hypothetical protein
MGRLVRVPRVVSSGAAPGFRVDAASYLERVVKYVPAEILALTMLTNAILDQAIRTYGLSERLIGAPVTTLAAAVVIAGTVLTPLFVMYVRKPGDAWLTHAIVSTLLFPFWAYALCSASFAGYWEVNFKLSTTYAPNGSVAQSAIWDGNLAATLLIIVTLLSGLITPRLRLRPSAEPAVAAPARKK